MYHCLSHMNGLLLILLINRIVISFPLIEFPDQQLTVGIWFIRSSKDTTVEGSVKFSVSAYKHHDSYSLYEVLPSLNDDERCTATSSFFKSCMHACSVLQSCPTLCDPHRLEPARLLCPWNFPGKNTGVGCHFLLQGIFLTQGSDLCLLHLLHWQADSLPVSHLGSPL